MRKYRMHTLAAVLALLLSTSGLPAAQPGAERIDAFAKAAAEMKKELGRGFIIERTGVFVVAGDMPRRRFNRFKNFTIRDCSRYLSKDLFDKQPDYPFRLYLFNGKS